MNATAARDAAYTIRRMRADEVGLALEWAAAEGWNPGLHDAPAFHAADPHGFFIGEMDGEPVGCLSAVAYGESLGFIGLYIVASAFRGVGLGIRLWNTGIEYLGERNIGLDGVVSQQANYRRSGFRLAYRNVRFEGLARDDAATCGGIVEASAVPFEQIADYDRRMFCAPREAFLRAWLDQPEGAALVALENGRVQGYGVLRACRSGYKIGPLFADDSRIADDLYGALVARVPGATVFLDVPEANPEAVALARRHGMSSIFETARMYTKAPPAVPLDCVFGVTSFELG
ncbi:N-acetyltransferase GCN5 [Caballeronia arationis]|jgi:ribosomal protein S18 acetylase RimI-like enzyme|uniref:Acetyltransferase (GNAT) family protein n=1 Tax=Caballeronia arationis TaxID=1777142 RepID=A0A7Z7I4Q8_9BURK|nr:GNAT family N-acetyltransferase [Caballeronia arationis]SAK54178.1 N-acetyltransferase GCN5 [Caballeronia arationis]SOE60829.1 Acetyltransferase (GNAT) family protein [Caballeronia arationis]